MDGGALVRLIYAASFLTAPLALLAAVAAARTKGRLRTAALAAAAPLFAAAYARFVEPHLLLSPTTKVPLVACHGAGGRVRLAVFSDVHVGAYRNAPSLARVAARLRALHPDAALFAGDWTFHAPSYDGAFDALRGAGVTIYSVYGNHDVRRGPFAADPALDAALRRGGVTPVDNRTVVLAAPGGAIEIAGLTDRRSAPAPHDHLMAPTALPRILLTHYPGWSVDLPDMRVDLVIAGHTHGGQIYIPFLTCRLIRHACEVVRRGLAEVNGRPLFVTSGVGLSALPFRFAVPPRIDVLEVSWPACTDAKAATG